MKTQAPYQGNSYDTPTVPLEGTMASIYILVLDLFIYFWKTTNSREDYMNIMFFTICHSALRFLSLT